MPTTLKPKMEAQIESLAERLALTDPNAHERVLQTALDDLDAKVPLLRRKMTPAEIAKEYRILSGGRPPLARGTSRRIRRRQSTVQSWAREFIRRAGATEMMVAGYDPESGNETCSP